MSERVDLKDWIRNRYLVRQKCFFFKRRQSLLGQLQPLTISRLSTYLAFMTFKHSFLKRLVLHVFYVQLFFLQLWILTFNFLVLETFLKALLPLESFLVLTLFSFFTSHDS